MFADGGKFLQPDAAGNPATPAEIFSAGLYDTNMPDYVSSEPFASMRPACPSGGACASSVCHADVTHNLPSRL